MALLVHEELIEIPGYLIALVPARRRGGMHPQPIEHRVLIDVLDLAQHADGGIKRVSGKCGDFEVGAGLLVAKVVAWEGDDLKPEVLVPVEHLLDALVVALGVAALAGHVDNEGDLAAERRDLEGMAFNVRNCKIIRRIRRILLFP